MKLGLGRNYVGRAGAANEVILPPERVRPDWQATLATWFLWCPGQSPAWQHYALSIVHLRDIEGVRPAHITVPGATHEVLLAALDPDARPVATDLMTWHILTPVNLCEQIALPADAAAVALLDLCARAVADGMLWAEPPLGGQVEPWRTVLIKSAAHARGEDHAP